MTPTQLTTACAATLPGPWAPTYARPRNFDMFLAGARWAIGRDPESLAATNGPVLVCVTLRPNGAILRVFAETSEVQVSDVTIAETLALLGRHASGIVPAEGEMETP